MTLSLPWLTTLFFIVIRLGTVLLFTPIQAIRQLPVFTRIILIFTLSIVMVHQVPVTSSLTNNTILAGGIAECFNGLIFVTSLYAAFTVFQIAGQIIDNEMGLNSSSFFNPAEHSQEPLSGHLLSMLAVLLFFGLEGHLWLFKGLVYSFIIIPPGTLALFSGFTPIIKQFGFMFSMALIIASPIVLISLTIDLCSAVITRNIPQLSSWFPNIPLKILLGFLVLTLMLPYLNPITNSVFERCFQTWEKLSLTSYKP